MRISFSVRFSGLILLLVLAGCGGGGGGDPVPLPALSSSPAQLNSAALAATAGIEARPAGAPSRIPLSAPASATVSGPSAEGWWTLAFSYLYDNTTYQVTVRFRFMNTGIPVVTGDTTHALLTTSTSMDFQATVTCGCMTLSQTGTVSNIAVVLKLGPPLTITAQGPFAGSGSVTYSADSSYRLAIVENGTVGVELKPITPKSTTYFSDLVVGLSASDGWTVTIDTDPDGTSRGTITNSNGLTVATFSKNADGKVTLLEAGETREVMITY